MIYFRSITVNPIQPDILQLNWKDVNHVFPCNLKLLGLYCVLFFFNHPSGRSIHFQLLRVACDYLAIACLVVRHCFLNDMGLHTTYKLHAVCNEIQTQYIHIANCIHNNETMVPDVRTCVHIYVCECVRCVLCPQIFNIFIIINKLKKTTEAYLK